jgi:uncharacterized protein YjbJ (UPF0337 family)
MNKDQIKGRVRKAKGKAKKLAGKLLHKPTLTAKGKVQETVGTAQAAYGDMKSTVRRRAASARRALRKKRRTVKKRVTSKGR